MSEFNFISFLLQYIRHKLICSVCLTEKQTNIALCKYIKSQTPRGVSFANWEYACNIYIWIGNLLNAEYSERLNVNIRVKYWSVGGAIKSHIRLVFQWDWEDIFLVTFSKTGTFSNYVFIRSWCNCIIPTVELKVDINIVNALHSSLLLKY